MKINTVAVLAVSLLAAGCGTIVRGTTEKVTINTKPTGAAVQTSIGQSCRRAPCTIEVKRRTAFDAYASKPGYKTGQVHVGTKFTKEGTASLAGNLLLPGGSVGAVVDVINGAALDHTPNPALIVLTPNKGGKAKARPRKGQKFKRRGTPVS